MKTRWKRNFGASSPPSPPCAIYGTLYNDEQPVGQGVIIQAVLDGKARGETITDASGKFGYSPWFKFPEEGLDSSEIGSAFEFWANQVKCDEIYIVEEVGKRTRLDLHATGIPSNDPEEILNELKSELSNITTTISQVINSLDDSQASLNDIGSGLDKLVEGMEPRHIPLTVSGKRGRYSINYLSEFITPYAKAVEDAAATLTDKTGDDLVIAAFNMIAPYPYIRDDRIWGYDRFNLPHETLNMQAGDCEDTSFLLASLLISAGVPRDRVACVLGKVSISGIDYGHAWVEYKRDDGNWYLLETTLDEWVGWQLVPAEYSAQVRLTDATWEEIHD